MKRPQTKKWTKELTWSEVHRATRLLSRIGLIDPIPESRLRRALSTSPNVQKRKVGSADSSPVYYRSRKV